MAEDWREKYLNLLDEQEQQLEQWSRTETLLKHTINRLSLYADGLSPELDSSLSKLRDLIRAKGQESVLLPLLEQLADKLSAFESSSISRFATPSQVLLYLAENIDWPRDQSKAVKELKSQIKRQKHINELPSLLQKFADVCVNGFQLQGDAEQESGSGLLGKLFGKKEQGQSSDSEVNRLVYQVLENVIAGLIKGNGKEDLLDDLKQCESEDDIFAMSDRIVAALKIIMADDGNEEAGHYLPTANELFIALLDRMSLPDELEAQAKSLKAQLEAPLSKEQWPSLMDKICDLVATMRRRAQQEKQDIERFLSSLTDSLKELDDRVQGASHEQSSHRESGQQLSSVMKAEMSGLANSVEQAVDLNVLKQAVQDRLDQIRNHMDAYQVEEEARFQSTQERMHILQERLHHLEQESDKLKERVKQQRNQALRDTLTGINNRLAYEERIETEHSRWKRFRTPVSLMIWDVDRFKTINDTFGHQAGDKVLVAIAKLLSSQIRESDFIARFGGEEFVVLAPGANQSEALALAEKLRQKIETSQFKHGDVDVPVTVSCGIVEFQNGYSVEQLFEMADRALYQAKLQGRNLCLCAEEGQK